MDAAKVGGLLKILLDNSNYNQAVVLVEGFIKNYPTSATVTLLKSSLLSRLSDKLHFLTDESFQLLVNIFPKEILQKPTGLSSYQLSVGESLVVAPVAGYPEFGLILKLKVVKKVSENDFDATSRPSVLKLYPLIFGWINSRLPSNQMFLPYDMKEIRIQLSTLENQPVADVEIHQHSFEVPLALSLLSYNTSQALSPDLVYTGEVQPDGRISSVTLLKEKEKICKRELDNSVILRTPSDHTSVHHLLDSLNLNFGKLNGENGLFEFRVNSSIDKLHHEIKIVPSIGKDNPHSVHPLYLAEIGNKFRTFREVQFNEPGNLYVFLNGFNPTYLLSHAVTQFVNRCAGLLTYQLIGSDGKGEYTCIYKGNGGRYPIGYTVSKVPD